MEGVAEVATLCDALSVDPTRFAELVAGGPLFSPWALQKLRKIIDNGVTQPEFPLRWAEKETAAAEDFGSYDRRRLPRIATAAKIARVS